MRHSVRASHYGRMKSTAALNHHLVRAALPALPPQIADELLKTIAETGTACTFDAGRIVFRNGDPGDCVYSVLSGALRVFRESEDGSIVDLGGLGPGDSFGEVALLDGGPRSATVQTLTPCQLFSLSREAFLAALPDSPQLVASVMANLVAHVRASSERVLRGELEQRAIRAEMEVERHRALTQMVAGVAHEINTPIGIVNTAASVVKQRIMSDAVTRGVSDPALREALEDVREAVDLIQANIQRAHKLIGTFKQLSVSQISDVRETLPLAGVIEDAIALFAISARQAKLEVQVKSTLPRGPEPTWVGYRGFLTQIVLNLLTNIERYAYPDGTGGLVEVHIGEACCDNEVHFAVTVRDFGRGMSEDAASRVFEPFFTTGRAKGATGLGMAIVRNLVTVALKGNVEVASEPGCGTAVTITFPMSIPD
jgi:signal transduction histidine kinase